MRFEKILFLALIFFSFLSCDKPDPIVIPSGPLLEENLPNVDYGTLPLQKMDIYLPAGRSTQKTKLIFMIHGGG